MTAFARSRRMAVSAANPRTQQTIPPLAPTPAGPQRSPVFIRATT